jgi:hypothetical protein
LNDWFIHSFNLGRRPYCVKPSPIEDLRVGRQISCYGAYGPIST